MTFRDSLTRWLPALALASAAASAVACGGRAEDKMNEGTAAQVSAPAVSANTRWSAPPALRHDEHVFAGGLAPPGASMHNPFTENADAAALGGQFFTAMNCDGCHGAGATGWVGPSLTARRWRYGGSDGDVYQSIFYGRPNGMPAFGGILPPDDIWRIVTYLRSLPLPADVPTESWP